MEGNNQAGDNQAGDNGVNIDNVVVIAGAVLNNMHQDAGAPVVGDPEAVAPGVAPEEREGLHCNDICYLLIGASTGVIVYYIAELANQGAVEGNPVGAIGSPNLELLGISAAAGATIVCCCIGRRIANTLRNCTASIANALGNCFNRE